LWRGDFAPRSFDWDWDWVWDWVTQGSPKGHPSVTQGSRRGRMVKMLCLEQKVKKAGWAQEDCQKCQNRVIAKI